MSAAAAPQPSLGQRLRARPGQRLSITALYASTAILAVLPLLALLFQGFSREVDGAITPSTVHLAKVLTSGGYWSALGNTVGVALGATVTACVIGVGLAWILVRTNVPGKRLLEQLVVVPMFIPPFIGAFAWLLMAAPRIGILNLPFIAGGIEQPFNVYTRLGMMWVMGLYLAPYVFLIVSSALRNMDPTLEEAAQVSGLTRMRTAATITLPIMKPAILSGAILAFVISIGLFGTPVLLGLTNQIYLVTTRIFLDLQQYPPQYGVIAILALYLMVLALLANALQQWALRGQSFVTVSGKNFRPREVQLGAARHALAALVWLYVVLAVVAPVAIITVAAASTYAWSGVFTLANLEYLWNATTCAARWPTP